MLFSSNRCCILHSEERSKYRLSNKSNFFHTEVSIPARRRSRTSSMSWTWLVQERLVGEGGCQEFVIHPNLNSNTHSRTKVSEALLVNPLKNAYIIISRQRFSYIQDTCQILNLLPSSTPTLTSTSTTFFYKNKVYKNV